MKCYEMKCPASARYTYTDTHSYCFRYRYRYRYRHFAHCQIYQIEVYPMERQFPGEQFTLGRKNVSVSVLL